MGQKIGIYTIANKFQLNETVLDAISQLYEICETTIVSVCSDFDQTQLVRNKFPKAILVNTARARLKDDGLLFEAIRAASREGLQQSDQLIITGAHILGPFGGLEAYLEREEVRNSSIFAAFAYRPQNEHRPDEYGKILERLPVEVAASEFIVLNREVLAQPGFCDALLAEDIPELENHIVSQLDIRITEFAAKHGFEITSPVNYGNFGTTIPFWHECESVLRAGVPFFSMHLVHESYMFHDLGAINLERALEVLRESSPEDYEKCWRHVLKSGKLRDIHAIVDEMEIIDEVARNPDKTEWEHGRIAVFIHAFYADMIDEFWSLLQIIDVPKKTFITTASQENRENIIAFLRKKGLAEDEFEIRVVEQNRGRDMSSLFISFRDVIISGDYDVCLRLHSKRTPQVPRQVGQSFKDHLFDNLVYTSGYVRNVLDFMEENPNVGLMMPPTIHIGFGTLGHSWFNNRKGVEEWADKMGLEVKFDDHTPLAPYGTMYWFRGEALRKMFEFEWRWDNYNEEPMHVDGGVAHLQERLIGYVAQDAGFRVVSIANRRDAARNYVRLEYKLQLLVAKIPHANIFYQHRYMLGFGSRLKTTALGAVTKFYQHHVMTRPGVHRVVRPMARYVKQILG